MFDVHKSRRLTMTGSSSSTVQSESESERWATRPAMATPGVLCISSEQLLGAANEIQIEHHGMLYRLKQTSLGKLILTK